MASQYIPGGGTIDDGSITANYQVGSTMTLSAFVQYEEWRMPLLAQQTKNNVTSALQVTFWPRHWGVKQ